MNPTITIRMYRSGLGDCFLLTLPDKQNNPFYILMDCGVFFRTPDEEKIMRLVVKDVEATIQRHLHLIVVSHEHYDHLCGFNHARDIFSGMTIDKIWFSWTEDPANDLANQLREEIEKKAEALHGLVSHLSGIDMDDQLKDRLGQVGMLLDFFGVAKANGKPSSTREALQFLKEDITAEKKYCYPGKVESLPELPGIRFFILGPPEDRKRIYKINPSQSKEEVYHLGLLKDDNRFMLGAFERLNDKTTTIPDDYYPFDATHRINFSDAKSNTAFFQQYYGFAPEHDNYWRNINTDWLDIAGTLALDLDDVTNNTSMVLAIQDIASGKVFLFPGDAQVGNWLSWDQYTWNVKNANGEQSTVTSKDLLAQTVFYKVGHHGSHNATMRNKGLEQMNHPELVAMIPVNQAFAKSKRPPATGWKMPFDPLLERLREKTKGRVIIMDEQFPKSEPEDTKPALLNKSEWNAFKKSCRVTDLYWEIKIPLRTS